MRKSYYDLGAAIRFKGSTWERPPHMGLANLNSDTFIKRYGPLWGDYGEAQDTLRAAWRGDAEAIAALEAEVLVERLQFGFDDKGMYVLEPLDLETYLNLLFLRDQATGWARVCQNPDCKAPYFIADRRGKRFCSHKCAVLVNVRRFRERRRVQRKKKRRRTRR